MGTGYRGDMEGEAMNVDRPQGLIEGSGRRGEPRRLDQMISARLDPVLVAALKQLAAKRGISLSDVLREAALLLLSREAAPNLVTFEMSVTNERLGTVTHESFRQDIEVAV
jgi:hypothetical protein